MMHPVTHLLLHVFYLLVKRSANGDFSPLALLSHPCCKFLIVKDEIAEGDALSGRP